jgi:hypothetical protein
MTGPLRHLQKTQCAAKRGSGCFNQSSISASIHKTEQELWGRHGQRQVVRKQTVQRWAPCIPHCATAAAAARLRPAHTIQGRSKSRNRHDTKNMQYDSALT